MQASLKSFVFRAVAKSVRSEQAPRTAGAPQSLPPHLHQFVGGGAAAPKRGWDVEAPKRGW